MDSPPPSDVLSVDVSTDGNAAVHRVLTLDDRKQGRERVLSSKDHQQQHPPELHLVKHDGVSSVLSKVRQ